MRSASHLPLHTRIGTSLLAAALAVGGALAAPGVAAAMQVADVAEGLVLQYDLTGGSGTTVTDSSGNGHDGTISGDATRSADGLQLGGTNGYVKLPDNIMSGLTQISVSLDVLVDPSQQTAYMIWAFGNTTAAGVGNGYLMATGNGYRTAIATGNWTTEQTVNSGANLQRGVWKSLTYTLDGSGLAIEYLDGVEVARATGVTIDPGDIGAGATTANYLGRSVYTADKYLKGTVRNFRIYDRALTAGEASQLSISPAVRVAADKAALTLGDTSAVTGNLTLPAAGSAYGTTISWASADPAVVSPAGVVTRGAEDRTVDLTATLSAGSGVTAVSDTKTFQVTVLAALSPQQRAQTAADALTVPNLEDVRGYLTLPSTGLDTATVVWTSSDPDTISASGVVHRPAHGSAATTVTLTASVTVAGATVTRDFTATVPALPQQQPYTGYAFAYFTGDTLSGEKIYLARSNGNNALSWTETNNGRPILTSTLGTKGVRDPFVLRSPEGDKFYLLATDLSIGSGTSWGDAQSNGSKYLEVWESDDLVHWSAQRHVKVAPDDAGDAWAPEASWSPEENAYVVYWASNVTRDGKTYHRMYTATTRDFYTFSAPKIWQDPGTSVIDSTVLHNGENYYRFTKDEGAATGCSDILEEKSTDLLAVDDIEDPAYDPADRNWEQVASCIGRTAGTSAVEGPTAFVANDGDTSGYDYYLFVDEYGGRGYIPLGSNDLATPSWTVPASYTLPAKPRHGTVLPVTQAELDALSADAPSPDPLPAADDGLVLDYPMTQTTGTTVVDASGNGNTGTLTGGATWTGSALSLGGTNGYVKLPDNAMAGLDAITVSADVYINSGQATPYFLWGMGNTDASGAGDGYLFATGNAYRTAITSGNWSGEQNATSGSNLTRGVWATLTYTLTPSGVATEYLNGARVAQNTAVTVKPGQIGGGYTTSNYIGRSVYTADKYLSGQVKNFRIYNRALAAGEVAGLAGGTGIVGSDSDQLKAPAIVTDASNLVVLPVKPGTDLTRFDPKLIIADTSTISETGPRDYTAPRTVTVIGTGGTRTWTIEPHVMNSPLIPGKFADPNIVKFGDTYYMYGTTDGFTGWSGTTFTVWSSEDLVNWESHDTILDLADVSWSHVNAWAPTITEKDGTYYFYFCAGGNVGVATSQSPLGPFVDKGSPLIARADYNNAQQIDPAVFTDDDGTAYLYWGNGAAYVAPLNADMTSIDVAHRVTITGLTNFREGMFMNERNGIYYLTYSIDDTGSENYRVGYATATSPTGPFTYQGEILNKRPELGILATGHSSIIEVPGTDDWYIAYHRFVMPGGNGYNRETTIDRLYFNADGTIKPVVPTLESIAPLDVTAPVTTATLDPADPSGENQWWNQPVTLILQAAEDGSGVATTQFAVEPGEWQTYAGPTVIDSQGAQTISFRSIDKAGNAETIRTIGVRIDTAAPEVAANVDGDDPVSVSLIADDETSGVAGSAYRIGSGDWQDYTGSFDVGKTAAAQMVQFRATDKAGNTSAVRSVTVPAKSTTPVKSTTSLSVSATSLPYGKALVATVRVSAESGGSIGRELVALYDGSTLVGAGVLRSGTAAIDVSGLTVGNHTLTARFAGNATVAESTSPAKRVTVVKASSAVALTLSAITQSYGTTRPVTLTATVKLDSGQPAAGRVRFLDGARVLATVPVIGGRATLKLSQTATVGKHRLSAVFLPSSTATTVGAASSTTTVTVVKATSATRLKASAATVRTGKAVVFTAAVGLDTKQQPVGSVRFVVDGKVVRTVAVAGGVARYSWSTTRVGRHSVRAQFLPRTTGTVAGSTGGPVSVTVIR